MPSRRKISQIQIDKRMMEYHQKVKSDIREARVALKAPTTDFLLQIKPQIQDSIDHGLSYKKIVQTIEEVFLFRVTENSLRNFANKFLHINKQTVQYGINNINSHKERREPNNLPRSSKKEKINQLLKRAEQHSDGDEF